MWLDGFSFSWCAVSSADWCAVGSADWCAVSSADNEVFTKNPTCLYFFLPYNKRDSVSLYASTYSPKCTYSIGHNPMLTGVQTPGQNRRLWWV